MSAASHTRSHRIAVLLAASAAFAGCTVGPNYKEPEAPVQSNFSTATTQPAAAATQPSVAVDPAGPWWTSFNDPTLNRLVDEAVNSNLNLRAAEARVREARAERGVVSS